MTRDRTPYSIASFGLIQKSRSISTITFSNDLPVCFAIVRAMRSRARRISFA
jgi:hypothetical protein